RVGAAAPTAGHRELRPRRVGGAPGEAADREEVADDRAAGHRGHVIGVVGAIGRHSHVELYSAVDLIMQIGPRCIIHPELNTAARDLAWRARLLDRTPSMNRRTLLKAAAAAGGAMAVPAARAQPAPSSAAKGPPVWLDLDQKALDDAYDQSVWATNGKQLLER